MSNYLFSACICTQCSLDTKDILVGCKSSSEFLCLSHNCCISADGKPYGVGMVTESDDICRIGLYCCTYGLIKPTTCCAGVEQLLCIKAAGSLPFDSDYVEKPICAVCFVKLYPTDDIGVLKEAPSVNAISR